MPPGPFGRLPGRRRLAVALLAPTLASTACSDAGTTSTAQWTGTRDTIAGVEIVTNPGTPLLGDGRRPEPREIWRATDTGAEGYWASPNRITVSDDRVYVLDRQVSNVYAVDAETGEDAGRIGGEGAGPGELQRPFGVDVVDEFLAVGNSGGPRIDLFALDGRYERSLRVDFLPFGMEVTRDGRLMLTGLEQGTGIVRLLDLDGTVTPYEPPDSSLVAVDIDYGRCQRWGAGPEGLLRAFCRRLAFQQLSATDGLLREVHADRPPVRATEDELDRMKRQLRQMVAEANLPAAQADRFVEERLEEARIKAVYAGIRGDPATGRIYVLEQTPAVLGGGPASLNVFDRQGRYLARIPFDLFWRDFRVLDDRVFALTEDLELGTRSLIAYDLDVSTGRADTP